MTELIKTNRAVFPPGQQALFLQQVEGVIGVRKMATACKCSERTIRDWRREKFLMSEACVLLLAAEAGLPVPTNFVSQPQYVHTSAAGKRGGKALIDKFGRVPVDEALRKEKWREWWDTKGQFAEHKMLSAKEISIPKVSSELAEYVGVILGDGGISAAQVTVTLHHKDDLEYAAFVTNLTERLFSMKPSVYHLEEKSVNVIVVSRVELVRYLNSIELQTGNKVAHQVDIPNWIKESAELSIACLRGLIDTDGCVFTHTYKSRGKVYSYKKIDFTSASEPLRKSVFAILQSLDMTPRLTNHNSIRLESIKDVERYFEIVGSHNPKHLNRYRT